MKDFLTAEQRETVERVRELVNDDESYHGGTLKACEDLLAIIDSLPKQYTIGEAEKIICDSCGSEHIHYETQFHMSYANSNYLIYGTPPDLIQTGRTHILTCETCGNRQEHTIGQVGNYC